jgi:GT2 family glycosyltransferase
MALHASDGAIRDMIPGALIVLFNPSEDHVTNLVHIRERCPRLVAVDNSPSVNATLHARMERAGIDIIPNFNRGGIAGAYNRGLEYLIKKGADLLFLFDQDSQIPGNFFVAMEEVCRGIDGPHFLVGPGILDINVNRYAPAHVVTRFGIRPLPLTGEARGLLRCSSIISSGSVMSAGTFRTLGPFREDYFIDQVDTEYCFRAVSEGIPIYINTQLTLKHQISRRKDHSVLSFRLIEWNMSPPRQYYSARNCVHIVRSYGAKFPVLILINVVTLQQLISIVLFERDKCRKLLAMAAGIVDGLRKRYGPFENCRPRISNICCSAEQ